MELILGIVSNMLDETSVDDLTAVDIARRMQALYHQDFTSRLANGYFSVILC